VHVASRRAGYAGLVDDAVLAAQDENERERRWHTLIEDGTDVLLAEHGAQVIGFAALAVPARELDEPAAGEITALYVDPAHWRRGVARALLDAAAAELRDEGCDVVVAWTLEAGRASRAFYAATGFTADGARARHAATGLDEIRLRARLD
jgi:GNAT superfamily N-acetyltransferase